MIFGGRKGHVHASGDMPTSLWTRPVSRSPATRSALNPYETPDARHEPDVQGYRRASCHTRPYIGQGVQPQLPIGAPLVRGQGSDLGERVMSFPVA
jgi:hypothetical protein